MSVLLLLPTELERRGLQPPRAGGTTVHVCGMGPVAAALGAAEALARGRWRRCVLLGLAGSRDTEVAPVGSLVVVSAVRNEAVGCGHAAGFIGLAEMAVPGEVPCADLLELERPALQPAGPAAGSRRLAALVVGVAGTVASASASVAEAEVRRACHPDVLVEEMEGHAVAQACLRAAVPLMMLRAVSNRAGDRDRARWDVPGALVALRAALPRLLESFL